ncbi:MAG TPA: HlyD family efflux transporter periplasmic adaptor subunit [Chloroflexota bacterium]|nr:HlyD family efflux transporter periplasmic adaptor subunit [Chloroflexota bacterium]
MGEVVQDSTTAVPGARASQDGALHHPEEAAPPPRAKKRGVPKMVVIPVLLIVLAVASAVGYRYWWNDVHYVSTDNAQIAGALVQVGAMNAGRVDSVSVDVGDSVQEGQVVGTVLLPSTISVSQSGAPRLDFVGSENQRADIKASISGIVVARQANVGDTVNTGQSIVTLVDPNRLWVQAQIEETKIGRVRVGLPVEVSVDSLGKTLNGKVVAINRASSATFSLLPSGNSSGNFTKVTQLVPVKISVDYGDHPLVLGSSVEVHIRVQE